ncbi:Y-family DNA polymerase [Parasphingorhabdus cellanae]|uniref:DNA polymerase Y family protein n=1 Tax=Parasphingorhabdus cellanae TaxID=2806553 RepID=A0ABX7T8Z1_9SPHN|nr:DNA polymerase Y family protein [Parasphingorhabdus cellanae]QTD57395.1 DNA polymerase Y family protein [Parasphingorhabdus cellanae]
MTVEYSRNTRRILALFLPFLSSERIIRSSAGALDTKDPRPFALVEKSRGALVLAALDRQAQAQGLHIAMPLADARARVPELLIFDHDRDADTRLLARLAEACERYTPVIALHLPQSLVLDISGCVHLFGDEQILVQDIEDRFDGAGLSFHWALAGTVDAALALARFGLKEGAQAQLPVAALDMNDKTHRSLERAGLYHIGDLAERPRAPLAARFGAELVLKLERLLGQEDRPVNPKRKSAAIITERRFAEPMGHIDSALLCLHELFIEAAQMLEDRKQGARKIRMQLFRCDGHVAELAIETGAPTRDDKLFRRLLNERVDTLNDPLDPGFGYDLVRLSIAAAESLDAVQTDMDGGRDAASDEAALLSQLSIRLGRQDVQRFEPANSYIPEHGLHARAALDYKDAFIWDQPESGAPPTRPLFLFDPPQHIKVMAEVPDGPPRRFIWKRVTHDVTRAEGPERIASTWWRKRQGHLPGKAGLTRDYYRVEDSEGRRYWLFRYGLYGTEKAQPDWYIHGSFA